MDLDLELKRQWVNSHAAEAHWCLTSDLAPRCYSVLTEDEPGPYQHRQVAGNSPRICQGHFCPWHKDIFSLGCPSTSPSAKMRGAQPGAVSLLRNTASHTTSYGYGHAPTGSPSSPFPWQGEKRDLPATSAKPSQERFPAAYSCVSAQPHFIATLRSVAFQKHRTNSSQQALWLMLRVGEA